MNSKTLASILTKSSFTSLEDVDRYRWGYSLGPGKWYEFVKEKNVDERVVRVAIIQALAAHGAFGPRDVSLGLDLLKAGVR